MSEMVYAKWKWCESCPHRRTDVKKEGGGVFMGFDWCGIGVVRSQYLHQFMDDLKHDLKPECPHYAEAMVEQLNTPQS